MNVRSTETVAWATTSPVRETRDVGDAAKRVAELSMQASDAAREYIRARQVWENLRAELDTAWVELTEARKEHNI